MGKIRLIMHVLALNEYDNDFCICCSPHPYSLSSQKGLFITSPHLFQPPFDRITQSFAVIHKKDSHDL